MDAPLPAQKPKSDVLHWLERPTCKFEWKEGQFVPMTDVATTGLLIEGLSRSSSGADFTDAVAAGR
jgi:hypothetical protein